MIPSRLIILVLFGVVSCQLSVSEDELLNWCLDSKYHKERPGPESELYSQCTPWKNRSCCTHNTTKDVHQGKLYNFNYDHCSHIRKMSKTCRKHFVQDLCFYECSPNVGPWVVKDCTYFFLFFNIVAEFINKVGAVRCMVQNLPAKRIDHVPSLSSSSLDLASSDFHLFRYLKHHLSGKRFSDKEEVEMAVNSWMSKQAAHFFEEGLRNLVIRYDKCITKLGNYVIKEEKVNMKVRKQRFHNVPLCKSDCDAWFNDCAKDYTCSSNWVRNWDWTDDGNKCAKEAECKTFNETYGNAKDFCEKVWDESWKYTPDEEPCMRLWFNNSNPNDKVAQFAVQLMRLGGSAAMSRGSTISVFLTSAVHLLKLLRT